MQASETGAPGSHAVLHQTLFSSLEESEWSLCLLNRNCSKVKSDISRRWNAAQPAGKKSRHFWQHWKKKNSRLCALWWEICR